MKRKSKINGFGLATALVLLVMPSVASAAPEPPSPTITTPATTESCYNADDLDLGFVDDADPDTTDTATSPFVATGTVVSTGPNAATSVELYEIPPAPAPAILIGTDVTLAGGVWEVTLTPVQTADGYHLLHAVAVNSLGVMRSLPFARVFCVDTIPPGAPTILSPTALDIGAGCVTNPFTISGTSEPFAMVIVEQQPVAPGSSTWTVSADRNGNWSIDASHEMPAGDHSVTIVARQRDGGRNQGPDSAAITFDVCDDKTPPAAPIITAPTSGGLPSDATLLIAGTFTIPEPGARVFIREFSVSPEFFADFEAEVELNMLGVETGNFSLLQTFSSSGIVTLRAYVVDANGNMSALSDPVVKMIDTDAPAARINLPSGFLLADIWILSDPEFSGTARDNYGLDHIEIVYDPILLGASVTTNPATCPQCPTDFDDVADPNDSFSEPEATWSDAPLLDLGLYEMQVTAVDLAGNRSEAATMLVLIVNP